MADIDVSDLERAVRDFAHQRGSNLAEAFRDTVRSLVPRRTQELHDSIEVDSVDDYDRGTRARVVVGAPYARFVNDGTGLYGPRGDFIRPRKAGGVLVFDWPAAGGIVFTRRVSGSEPTHFWERALDQWPRIVAGEGA